MNLKEKFDLGVSAAQFLDSMDSDQRSLHDTHSQRAEIDFYREKLRDFKIQLRILIITEPWCGDSVAIVPVALKLLEGVDSVEIRFVYRDENPDLMDRYLTKGARSIPKFIVMDASCKELTLWGPRPKVVQDIFEGHREQINSGEIEKSEVMIMIRKYYSKDRGRAIAEELTELLLNTSR